MVFFRVPSSCQLSFKRGAELLFLVCPPDILIIETGLVGGLEHLDYFPIQLGMSSSQLTFTPSFFRGVA